MALALRERIAKVTSMNVPFLYTLLTHANTVVNAKMTWANTNAIVMGLDSLVNDVKSQLMIASLVRVVNMAPVRIWSMDTNVIVKRVIRVTDVSNRCIVSFYI